jgi:hypothetical protein
MTDQTAHPGAAVSFGEDETTPGIRNHLSLPRVLSAQVDLLGGPRPMIGVELSAAPSGANARRRRRVNIAG